MTSHDPLWTLDQPLRIGSKTVHGRLVIPSGIRCTRASTIAACFADVAPVGVITTKSISFAPRAGYREPIYARYAPESYINAVGLANPGAEQFRRELEEYRVPADKFLLVSIFGGNVQDFVQAARALRPVGDGFELNMSCPHAAGYGAEIGQSKELVAEITQAVVQETGLPVIVKLSGIVGEVGVTAREAVAAGAAGITVTNTIGPALVPFGEKAVLSHGVGGLSGTAIRPLALRAVKRVREALGPGPLVIGMGGISTPEDIRQFRAAGADLFGVGSAITGMNSEAMRKYFDSLAEALRLPQGFSQLKPPPQIPMQYRPSRVVEREEYHPGLFKLILDRLPIRGDRGELAGKYFFLFIPGIGEKPFAVFSAAERSLIVKVVGQFTEHLSRLEPGGELFLRGPYGAGFPLVDNRTVVLLGGGSGIASLFEIAELLADNNDLHFALGGRSAKDLFDLDKFSNLGPVKFATNDGSSGHHGFVSELLAQWLHTAKPTERTEAVYVVCGPEPMVEACFNLLAPVTDSRNIWGAVEYMTSCGVGICGKCASPSGNLSCIDGPFMQLPAFQKRVVHTPTEAPVRTASARRHSRPVPHRT